jgi:hypothetical protein
MILLEFRQHQPEFVSREVLLHFPPFDASKLKRRIFSCAATFHSEIEMALKFSS